MQEDTDDFVLRSEGDAYVLRPKIIWVQAMMLVLAPMMMFFVVQAFRRGAHTMELAELLGSALMAAVVCLMFFVALLQLSSLVVSANEVAFRLGFVWRRRSLEGVRTCHTKPLPKGHFSLVELELEDGSRKELARLQNAAADRLADLICEVVGVETPAESGQKAAAKPSDIDISGALCSPAEYAASQPSSARSPLTALYTLLERRWAGGNYNAPAGLESRLLELGFHRIGSSIVVWSLLPFPIRAATYVSEDGAVVAELLRAEGDKYHFLSHTTAPMARWSWSKINPTTKSSQFIESAPSTGSLELDYAAHREWLAEQVRQGARVARVQNMDDHLVISRVRSLRLTSDATVFHLLFMPLIMLIPLAVAVYKVATQ